MLVLSIIEMFVEQTMPVGFSAFRHYHWRNNKDQNLHLEDVNTLVEPRYLAIVYRLVNQIVQSKYLIPSL